MAENIRVDGLDKVVVGPGIDYLKSGGFGFVRTEYNYESINFTSYQPTQKLRALADTAITQRKAQ